MTSTEKLKTTEELREQLRDYVAYTLTSAKGLYREPHSYGPMRLIDSMERALSLLEAAGIKADELEKVLAAIKRERWRAMTDPQAFGGAIDEAVLELVELSVGK